jgi:NADH dehydrogenase (ubiquinone) 1 alpha subcomplex subunit 5
MLRALASGLPSGWRAASQAFCVSTRNYADLNLSDPKVFKKFVGIEDSLGSMPNARGKLQENLEYLLDAVKELPESSDYRRAVEATTQYRLKVLASNDSDQAVEEVLDSHLEELIIECRDELSLIPLMSGGTPAAAAAAAAVPSCIIAVVPPTQPAVSSASVGW